MNKSIVSLLLLAATIVSGAVGYHYIERFPVIDALYMAVITITTVGFGEIHPLSEVGRLYTMGLILVGFVVLGFFGSSLAELLMERVWSGKYRGKKMKKQIEARPGGSGQSATGMDLRSGRFGHEQHHHCRDRPLDAP